MFSLITGESLEVLKSIESESIDCCVTSPPYFGLRDYGVKEQIGLEKTPEEYIDRLVLTFREVRRVLKPQGTLWVNIGDSYAHSSTGGNGATSGRDKSTLQSSMPPAGIKSKNLIGIPWMLAFALRKDGWYLRQEIIWHKPNPMPESVKDRCTKAHEQIFLLSKSPKYFYNSKAIEEPCVSDHLAGNKSHKGKAAYDAGDQKHRTKEGLVKFAQKEPKETRNARSVWSIASSPTPEAHFAVFPYNLPLRCILAGSPEDGVILDPFCGAGTTAWAALEHGRSFIGIEINPEYASLTMKRLETKIPLMMAWQREVSEKVA